MAERLALPERLRAAAPAGRAGERGALIGTERVLASVIEAVIGACYLHAGYERTAEAVVEAFAPEIEDALSNPVDFKSALQELLARRGAEVGYEVRGEEGPPHERVYSVVARVDGKELGSGRGRSKKHAEQEAARMARRAAGERVSAAGGDPRAAEVADAERLQVVPRPHAPGVRAGRERRGRARTARASRTSPTPCCGRWASSRRWPCGASRCRT